MKKGDPPFQPPPATPNRRPNLSTTHKPPRFRALRRPHGSTIGPATATASRSTTRRDFLRPEPDSIQIGVNSSPPARRTFNRTGTKNAGSALSKRHRPVLCMDLLAPILTYFGSVVAIVLAFAMSYDAFVYAPLHSTVARHVVMVAKAAAPGPAATADAKVVRVRSTSVTISSHHAASARTDLASDAAPAKRRASLRGTIARQQYLRRLPSQLRANEWAYQQGPLRSGFADESVGGFGYGWYQ
jgi:hypothetical protein